MIRLLFKTLNCEFVLTQMNFICGLNSEPHLQCVTRYQLTDVKAQIITDADVPKVDWVLEQNVGGRKQPKAI